ncbi:hypothetical protein [Anaerospora hongkongensis]|uniref:hypothetical protein n=1 Tax=Anaerospora hongkongensis TaxID=244830 RepID=UPI002898EA9F|nr:hypothetical protein [Anaerospora hongkongensis]
MVNVHTDPFCLACPLPTTPLIEVEKYIDFLIELDDIAEAWWIKKYIPKDIYDILVKTNGYPNWALLENAINRLGKIYHPSDINRILEKMLQRSNYIEDKFEIKEILADNVICQPSFYKNRGSETFVSTFERLVLLIGFYYAIHNLPNEDFLLVRDLTSETEIIHALAEIAACEFQIPTSNINIPYAIDHSVTACQGLKGICSKVDVTKIWLSAQSVREYKDALQIKVFQRNSANCSNATLGDSRNWGFGRLFLKTLKDLGFSTQANKANLLLRSGTETILNENMNSTHPLRVGSGGNDPQRIRLRDGAKAWRRDIDYDYHLHYWESTQGIEFASVVTHNDMSIPE